MLGVNRALLVRSAALQTVLVGVLSAILAIALGAHFFTHWGWLVGPAAWLACAWATARVLSLPSRRALVGAVLAGLPSIAAVAAGLHWLGDVVAIALFALWCAWMPRSATQAWST
jgi:hypothetical protein